MTRNRVSVEVYRHSDHAPTICAYLDGKLIAQGYSFQWPIVMAFAHEVARGHYELDESPFGGYYELSFDELDEWYRDEFGGEWRDDAQDFGACDSVMVTLEGYDEDGVHVHWTDFRLTGEQARVMLTALAEMED